MDKLALSSLFSYMVIVTDYFRCPVFQKTLNIPRVDSVSSLYV